MCARPLTRRIAVYNPQDQFLFDIPCDDVSGYMSETINGPHQIEITSRFVLEKEMRLLIQDAMLKWREFVVAGIDEEHQGGQRPTGTYRGVWSLQHDLKLCTVSRMPGVETPVLASVALSAALSGTSRWVAGTVTVTSTGGVSMYEMSSWEAISAMLEVWGGEIDADIRVDEFGVVSRRVNYLTALGSTRVTRRFDYSRDLVGIKRTVSDDPVAVRIIPRGKGEDTGYGYGRKIKIGDVNGGIDWLQNDESAELYKLPNGSGGYEYPTIYVDNGDLEYEELLLDWGLEVLNDYTTPQVTYESTVHQYAAAGMDPSGVALGDVVQCVDRAFREGGLRINGRVTSIRISLSDERETELTIGHAQETMSSMLGSMKTSVRVLNDSLQGLSATTAQYLSDTLSVINRQINATGGYTYLVDGKGIRTYDKAVTDPAVGTEADAVVEIKGGSIRIANTRTQAGEWNWKTVFVSGHVLAELVTAAQLVSGYIGSAVSGNYWNLDTGELRMAAANVTVGNQTLAQYVSDATSLTQSAVFNALTNNGALQGLYMYNNNLYINASYIASGAINASLITSGKIQSANGKVYFDLTNNEMHCDKLVSTASASTAGNFSASVISYQFYGQTRYGLAITNSNYTNGTIRIYPGLQNQSNYNYRPAISSDEGLYLVCGGAYSQSQAAVLLERSGSTPGVYMTALNSSNAEGASIWLKIPNSGDSGSTYHMYLTTKGSCLWEFGSGGSKFDWGYYVPTMNYLHVSGTKNRVVGTEDYGDRLLYCYETPSPMFGDVGSAVIDDDGVCVVGIDDVFSETARVDLAYQVFLQKCGPGDLWVSRKAPTYFIVEGTPSLAFDWEIKARQKDFEAERLEDLANDNEAFAMGHEDLEPLNAYGDDLNYIEEIESLYEELA